jgi:hypothetical protein
MDRFTLCHCRSQRFNKLVDTADQFVGKFPEVQSSLMKSVLRKKGKGQKQVARQLIKLSALFSGRSLAWGSRRRPIPRTI